ncbi:capsid assembly protein [Magnetospirillum sulfuroxidans]|uniref:Uncharacterized protein n=1 Tax=Magnetospirillum sulfuroxidans TaxID=611300 RepID=A0ABS5IC97_9PROT|nr:hypothetical protein [Magnetospirillum sulfuroxidans]MBR9971787.1 hypothetical protein [Magnetospirillum sulfuroxidans]
MYYEDSLEPEADPRQPTGIPDKFRDPATGGLRTEALLQAYQDLERRMHRMVEIPGDDCSDEQRCAFHRALGVPDSPDQYAIEQRHPMLSSDAEVNRALHQAGFTPKQAQLVYDLAHQRVIPTIEQMAGEYESQRSLERLRDHFGGDAKWSETARQVSAWGQSNLAPEVYQALATSADGIIAMRAMMNSGEPSVGRQPSSRESEPSEGELKKMLQDPRYWKQRDPAFIDKVSTGFRRLYGE